MFSRIRLGLRALFHPAQTIHDMEDELHAYDEAASQENMRRGMDPEQARRSARLDAGSADAVKERTLSIGWENHLQSLAADLRYAARRLRRSPGFTFAAVLTLALGIGANTAIFSMASWLLFRPLHVDRPQQLNFISFATQGNNSFPQFSYPEFLDLQRVGAFAFSDMAMLQFGGLSGAVETDDGLTIGDRTRSVTTEFVTGNFFSLLGLHAYAGRLILATEGASVNADPIVVLSYAYWQTQFNGDPNIIGKSALLNGHPVTIVGIAPKGFHGVTPIIETQAYLPLGMDVVEGADASSLLRDRKSPGGIVIARRRSGVTRESAEASLAALGAQFIKETPRPGAIGKLLVKDLRPPGMITGVSPFPILTALFLTLTGLVLLLAAVNVANLLLVRTAARRQELAVRSALGAARIRILRQVFTESFLLAAMGALAGLLFGYFTCAALRVLPVHTSLPLVLDFRLDWRSVAYALTASLMVGIGMAAAVAIGAASVLHGGAASLAAGLRESARGYSSHRQRLRTALTGMQIVASLVLLIAAGLFVRSLRAAANVDLGFDSRSLLNLIIDPYGLGYTEPQATDLYRRLLDRARALPGVRQAALTMSVPLGERSMNADVDVPGYEVAKNQLPPSPVWNTVTPGFFDTLGIPLLRGRDFTLADNQDALPVAVINQTMAERFWPRQDPLGRTFTPSSWKPARTLTVIAVARDARTVDLTSPIQPTFYLPLAQNYQPVMSLVLRTDQPAALIAPTLRDLVTRLAPAMLLGPVHTMQYDLQGPNGIFFPKLAAMLAAVLGAIGLVLAITGVYGVISYNAARRTQEIGLRIALGALPGQILRMICRQSLILVGVSIALGLLCAYGLARLLSDFLIGVTPTDLPTYSVVTAFLVSTALLAGYLPARRASRINPTTALRHE